MGAYDDTVMVSESTDHTRTDTMTAMFSALALVALIGLWPTNPLVAIASAVVVFCLAFNNGARA